jgi:hypothetical protein
MARRGGFCLASRGRNAPPPDQTRSRRRNDPTASKPRGSLPLALLLTSFAAQGPAAYGSQDLVRARLNGWSHGSHCESGAVRIVPRVLGVGTPDPISGQTAAPEKPPGGMDWIGRGAVGPKGQRRRFGLFASLVFAMADRSTTARPVGGV